MIAFVHADLIDGTGSPVRKNQTILTDGKKITAVGASSAVTVPEGAVKVDLTGKTVLPGLIDAHAHIGGNAGFDHPPHTGRILSYDFAEGREQFLQWGVTTVRDAGGFMPDIVDVRDDINSGKLRGPRIIAAGRMIQAVGGHPWCSVLFKNEEIRKHELFFLNPDDGKDKIDALIKQEVDEGVDWIKIIISDDNCMAWPHHLPRLSQHQLCLLVEAGHRYGKPVMAHCDGFDDIEMAVDAGVDSFEHTINNGAQTGHELTDTLLEKILSRSIWSVPTIIGTFRHDGSIKKAAPVMPYVWESVGKMIHSGVHIAAGCDSGIPFVPFGFSLHEEMELLVKAGMTPLQAITTATGENAKLLHHENDFGTIRKDLCADLMVCDGHPAEKITDTRNILLVLREGAVVIDHLA